MCFMDKYRKRFHGCAMVRKCLHGKSFLWSKNIKSVSDLFNVVATFRGWIQFRKFVCAKDLFAKPRLHKSIFTDISIYPLPLWLHSRIKLQNFRLPYLWTKVKGKWCLKLNYTTSDFVQKNIKKVFWASHASWFSLRTPENAKPLREAII